MTATPNGRPPRKQLSAHLDRLDSILDALADALPQAVADACEEGARPAVKDAVREVLATPDVRTLLATSGPAPRLLPGPPPAEAKPHRWDEWKGKLAAAKGAVGERAKTVAHSVTLTARTLAAVMPLTRIAPVTLGVGRAVGLTALLVYRFCPPALAAAVSGVGAAVTAAAAQVTGVLRKGGWLAPTTTT